MRRPIRLEAGWSMRILQGILLSLGVHLLLVWGSQLLLSPSLLQSQSERIEFEVIDPSTNSARGQVVRQPLVPDEMLTEDNDDFRYLSERRQRVREQRRAERTGITENRAQRGSSEPQGEGGQSGPRPPRAPDLFRLNPSTPEEAGEIAARRERQRQNQDRMRGQTRPQSDNLTHLPQGFSTVGETLPNELEVGSFTSLNTDRYLFYSFFVRIEDLIRYNWESYVKDTINRTPRSHFLQQSGDTWITQVEIQLKPNGEFHRALLLKSAGIEGFDWAAVDAFSQAKLFPNPPQEMIEEDGLIHLQYSFTVRYRPTAMGSGPGRPAVR